MARWVVGCDGMHSAVREAAGIPFEGGRYGYNFVLADLRMDWPLPRDEADGFLSAEGILAVFPLPPDRFRVIATVPGAPEHPSADFIQAILDARGPRDQPARVRETLWTSRFRIHHRVAQTLRKGPILLCGDAAHLHSPAGGQGMNTGIQDAMALAEPLVRALRQGDTGGLDAWAVLRRQRARQVVSLTDRITRVATTPNAPLRLVRNAALRVVNLLPGIKQAIATSLAEPEPPGA